MASESLRSVSTDLPQASGVCLPTRWTLVLQARGETPEAREALAQLCEIYYKPVLEFLKREQRTSDAAQDLAQEFFTRILSGSGFAGAEQQHGRFRSYVLGALKHFLADALDHERRLKRGGGVAPVSLDSPRDPMTMGGGAPPEPSLEPADINFDRQWAMSVMGRATTALEQEFTASGKADQFGLLKMSLIGDGSAFSIHEVAHQLCVTEATLRVVVHRFRKRFRELVRGEIRQTLKDPQLVDEELRHLIEALSAAT